MMLYGGIIATEEFFTCAIGNKENEVIERRVIPTQSPEVTMHLLRDFFEHFDVSAVAMGCFGIVSMRANDLTSGKITLTKKDEWQNFDMLSALKEQFQVPVLLQSDTNVTAYGELQASPKEILSTLFLDIGKNIEGAYITRNGFSPTLFPNQMAHLSVKRIEEDDFVGVCPYHSDCLQALVSVPAVEKRSGRQLDALHMDDSVWDVTAYYLAEALQIMSSVLAPDQIILSGPLMCNPQLLSFVQRHFRAVMNERSTIVTSTHDFTDYIQKPKRNGNTGIIGALFLAQRIAK